MFLSLILIIVIISIDLVSFLFFMVQDNFKPFKRTLLESSSTVSSSVSTEILSQIGSVHDIESKNNSLLGVFSLFLDLFVSHWGHLSVIFSWASALYFHIAWTGNYELWILNPLDTLPIAHSISDPQFGTFLFDSCFIKFTSGLYNILITVGVTCNDQIYFIAISFQFLSLVCLIASILSSVSLDSVIESVALQSYSFLADSLYNSRNNINFSAVYTSVYRSTMKILLSALTSPSISSFSQSYHLSFFLATSSLLWGMHLIYFSDPSSTGLTFHGGLDPATNSLYISDIAHHHIAVSGILFWVSSLTRSISAATGIRISDLARAAAFLSFISSHAFKSIHSILAFILFGLSFLSFYTANITYFLPAYKFLSLNSETVTILYSHHIWISLFLFMGASAHLTIYIIRDVSIPSKYSKQGLKNPVIRLVKSKAAVISHLSYVSLFLGFHVFGLYVHNDCVSAFGHSSSQILIEPIFSRPSLDNPYYLGIFEFLNLIVNVISPASSSI